MLTTLLIAAAWSSGAHARGPAEKIAKDLEPSITAAVTPKHRHTKDINGVRHVQAIVVTDGSDPEMTDLRAQILRSGGSVHAVFPSLHSLSVQIKAQQVQALAQRADVVSVSPNRATQSTASTLETITGALTSNVRTYSSKTAYSGVDGSGIGIAVLDSGVMRLHDTFERNTVVRVKRNVNMLNTTLANWTTGVAGATSLTPGSSALTSYENTIANDGAKTQDAYGHGTHVAAVAAGNYYVPKDAAARDINGIAPGANIYDVKVLDGYGVGTLSDVLEGIQWVIYHAKEYNIRVLNLSLAAGSTESWQTDPLCAAVRSATAAGITVVVAAGNFGQSILGQEVYGAISAPGNDPSVITVGAVNDKGSTARASVSRTVLKGSSIWGEASVSEVSSNR